MIVIGGGTMGTATGWALARAGHSVTVIEQFEHVHGLGSHGGKTRIFRHNYAEGEQYVPWTLEADLLWAELQERNPGERFMHRCGGLDISTPDGFRAQEAMHSAQRYDLDYELLRGTDINERYPAWNLPADWTACLDPTAGFLVVPPALKAMAREMAAAGGDLRTGERVLMWEERADDVLVATDRDTYSADRLVIAGGAWNGALMRDLGLPLEVRRKPVFWFEPRDPSLYAPDRFPVFVVDLGVDEFYGLPVHGDPGLKCGIHSGGNVVNPDAIDREVRDDDLLPAYRAFLAERFNGLSATVLDSTVCMYTMTPDEHFLIDRYPGKERVIYAAGFSGHGFKFAPVVGEYLATLATDDHAELLPWFAYERFLGAPQ